MVASPSAAELVVLRIGAAAALALTFALLAGNTIAAYRVWRKR